MEPAICAAIDYALPFAELMPLIREAGFGVIAIGARPEYCAYDTDEGRERIRRLADDNGLRIDSVHAPFPEGDRLCSLEESERLESLRQCQVALDAAHDLAVDIVVVHLNTSPDAAVLEQMMDQGIRSIAALAEHALTRGVRLAVENSWGEPYAMMLDRVMTEFDREPVGLCYDSGHENVQRTGFRDLNRYGHRILTLHLHDNLGEDTHALPYEGDTDWPRFMELLRGFDYCGNLLLEVGTANSAFKDPARFLAEAHRRAVKLLENP